MFSTANSYWETIVTPTATAINDASTAFALTNIPARSTYNSTTQSTADTSDQATLKSTL